MDSWLGIQYKKSKKKGKRNKDEEIHNLSLADEKEQDIQNMIGFCVAKYEEKKEESDDLERDYYEQKKKNVNEFLANKISEPLLKQRVKQLIDEENAARVTLDASDNLPSILLFTFYGDGDKLCYYLSFSLMFINFSL
jgi:hypothetical protein